MAIRTLHHILMACVVWMSFSVQAQELKFNTQDFPPFSYLVDGAVAGPGVDVIKRVCKEANLSCSFNLLPWLRAQREVVDDGTAHALFMIGWNEERAKILHFTPPVVKSSYGFFVHADDPLEYRKPADVVGYTVGVFGPSNTSKSLDKVREQMIREKLEPLVVELRPDDESGFMKLGSKRVQAVYSNREVGLSMISKLGLKNIRFSGTTEHLNYYVGFSKKNVDQKTVDQFNQAFRKLHKEGAIGKILAGYQMKDVPQKNWDEK